MVNRGNEGTCLTSRLGERFSSPNAVNYSAYANISYQRGTVTASYGLPLMAFFPFEMTVRSINMG